ncbi:hypothetical protein T484DRAFT_1915324, partial [Baffinella frigidus]
GAAQRSGRIFEGDVVTVIQGGEVDGSQLRDVVQRLVGLPRSFVTIRIRHSGGEAEEEEVTLRSEIGLSNRILP